MEEVEGIIIEEVMEEEDMIRTVSQVINKGSIKISEIKIQIKQILVVVVKVVMEWVAWVAVWA